MSLVFVRPLPASGERALLAPAQRLERAHAKAGKAASSPVMRAQPFVIGAANCRKCAPQTAELISAKGRRDWRWLQGLQWRERCVKRRRRRRRQHDDQAQNQYANWRLLCWLCCKRAIDGRQRGETAKTGERLDLAQAV